MNTATNPFQQLYVADPSVSEEASVKLFSAEVLQSAVHPIFQGGNVILLGSQGCGKTMLLNLLRPELRLAYHRQEIEFPVERKLRRFVSAGVNLSSTQLVHVSEKSLESKERNRRELPLLFSDYFNYCVIANLLHSIRLIGDNPGVFSNLVDKGQLDEFATRLSQDSCWHGAFDVVSSISELIEHVDKRIYEYGQWINGNIGLEEFESRIISSKSFIGAPISKAAALLRELRVIERDVPVLIRIDQLEELTRAGESEKEQLFTTFRKLLNRLLADRDAHVFYRIGSRPYGFDDPSTMGIWGSDAKLERRRDYVLIDMDDELFVRSEEGRVPIFPSLIRDAFRKRVAYAYELPEQVLPDKLLDTVFGRSPTNVERLSVLKSIDTVAQRDRLLGLDRAEEKGKWSTEWISFLHGIIEKGGKESVLDAVLAAAWGRQTGGGGRTHENREEPPPPEPYPWVEREWWRKERMGQAVLQASTRGRQRFAWWGAKDIEDLADGNITVFLHLCHRIWDAFLKQQAVCSESKKIDVLQGGGIPVTVQRSAIYRASDEWYRKLAEEPLGKSRQRFVHYLGEYLNRNMLNDLAMSYPGANGFSIALGEYDADSGDALEVRRFLEQAVGYSVLRKREHSSKSKSTGRRVKFYFIKLLCVRYQLPDRRTKEPLYVALKEVREWLGRANVLSAYAVKHSPRRNENQRTFEFNFDQGEGS